MKKRKQAVIFSGAVLLLLAGLLCVLNADKLAGLLSAGAPVDDTTAVADLPQPEFSAWLPYWDYGDALNETELCASALNGVVAFAALFSAADDSVLLNDATEATVRQLQQRLGDSPKLYLAVVNDVQLSDGQYLSKDTQVLERLFASEAAMEAHIAELLAVCRKYQVDGLEIDYENISDAGLWSKFTAFLTRLYARTEQAGLLLRVDVGSAAYKQAEFPTGPEYVIMCYNLYGSHSAAGPKADKEFLLQVCKTSKSYPGTVTLALADGGFDWAASGACRAVTQVAAEDLRAAYQVPASEVSRDAASQALNFKYEADGIAHEVWYADGETLSFWTELLLENGIERIGVWRLGGNVNAELKDYFDKFTGP